MNEIYPFKNKRRQEITNLIAELNDPSLKIINDLEEGGFFLTEYSSLTRSGCLQAACQRK